MSGWQQQPSTIFRALEEEQRALAKDATSKATRDIHLEFAERYRLKAEEREAEEQPQTSVNPGQAKGRTEPMHRATGRTG